MEGKVREVRSGGWGGRRHDRWVSNWGVSIFVIKIAYLFIAFEL
jgi:hypothetical protein